MRCLAAYIMILGLAATAVGAGWLGAPHPVPNTPYEQVAASFNGEQARAWGRRLVDGRQCLVSGVLQSPKGYETNHHRVVVDFTGTGAVSVSVVQFTKDNLGDALAKTRRPRFHRLKSGREKLVSVFGKQQRCAWLILEVTGQVKITGVRYSCWRGRGTIYGHVGRYFEFAGAKLPYRLLYPNNYDPRKTYPLVLSVAGSKGVGSKNIRNMERVILAGRLFTIYYQDPELACFSVVPQIPPDKAIPAPYWPRGDRGKPTPIYHPAQAAVNENGWYTQASLALIRSLIADAKINVDPNRVYFTGFSYGGKACWEFLKAGPDVFAGAISAAGWAIGRPYSKPRGPMLDRLKLEVKRYKHVPVHVIVGAKDKMRFSSRAVHEEILAQGGKSTYVEIPKANHVASAAGAWNNRKHLEWLFRQTRLKAPKLDKAAPATSPAPATKPTSKPTTKPAKRRSPLDGFRKLLRKPQFQ